MQRFFVLIFGLIFLGLGAFLFIRNQNFVKNCTVETEATIVDIKEEFSSDGDGASYSYYPIYEYKVGEEVKRVKSSSSSSVSKYNIGDKVTIFYNPNKTTEFIVKGEKSSSIFSIVFIVLGVLISGYGIKLALSKEE